MRGDEVGAKPVVRALGRSMGCPWPCPVSLGAEAAGADAGTLGCPFIHLTVLTWCSRLAASVSFLKAVCRLITTYTATVSVAAKLLGAHAACGDAGTLGCPLIHPAVLTCTSAWQCCELCFRLRQPVHISI